MKHSNQGIVRDGRAEEQPADKERAQAVHRTNPQKSVSREATRERKLGEAEKASHNKPDHRGR